MPANESKIGNLEDEALKRKERLRVLKAKREGKTQDQKDDDDDKESLPKPCFRSYLPENESLQENVLPKVKPESVEEQVKGHLEAGNPEPLIGEVELKMPKRFNHLMLIWVKRLPIVSSRSVESLNEE